MTIVGAQLASIPVHHQISRMRSALPLMCLIAGVAVGAPPVRAHAQSEGATRSTLDGVFTAVQATRGRETFLTICSACHTSGQFKGATFQSMWLGRSVGDLFELIRTTMPNDNPNSLSRAEYAGVVAYILQLNGFPARDKALPSDRPGLKQIRFDSNPDSARGSTASWR